MRVPRRCAGWGALVTFGVVALGSWGVGWGAAESEPSVGRVHEITTRSQPLGSKNPIDEKSRVSTNPVSARSHPEGPPSNPFSSPASYTFGDVSVRGDPRGGLILGETTPHTSELVIELAIERISGSHPWSLEVAYPPSVLGRVRVVPPARTAFQVDHHERGKLVVTSGSSGIAPHPSRRVVSRSDSSGVALLRDPGGPILHVGRFAIPLSERGALEDQNLPLELALDISVDEAPGARPRLAFARFSADIVRSALSEPLR